jgi:hypothetical protein
LPLWSMWVVLQGPPERDEKKLPHVEGVRARSDLPGSV